jgi:hypothetical protein
MTPAANRSSEPGTTAVALPQLAVAPHVLVISLGTARSVRSLVAEWLELDSALLPHRAHLEELLWPAEQPRIGEVAAFMSYREVDGDLVGGAAVLSLELIGPYAGSPGERADQIAVSLRRTAESMGHVEGLTQVERRRTTSGVAAARVRFLGAMTAEPVDATGAVVGMVAMTPLIEACRWLYPVPGHPDLLWVLVFQTTDLDHADELVAEFDRMAASLTWVEP